MSFLDCVIKSEYRSLIDSVVQDFYLPILHEAVSYKRCWLLLIFCIGGNIKRNLRYGFQWRKNPDRSVSVSF